MNSKPIIANHEPYKETVVFNPVAKHWYLDTHSSDFKLKRYPTKHGEVDSDSLTQKMEATLFFSINIEHFTSYDVLFLRDNLGRIAVFTMVSTDSEFGSFYRSDHKGFCYKNAHLYIDTRDYHQMMGVKHYLTTEDLSGKWSLICIYKPQDYVPGAYNEFTARVLIAKSFSSEKGVLDHFKDVLKVYDLRDTERFTFIDVCNPPDNL